MTDANPKLVAYVLRESVVINGQILERGSIGPAEEFGDAFGGLLAAGMLQKMELTYNRPGKHGSPSAGAAGPRA